MKRKIIGFLVCTLFLFSMFLPNINAIRTIEKNILTEDNNEGLVGKLSIDVYSTDIRTIITKIFDLNPEDYHVDPCLLSNMIGNFNSINVTVEQQIKLESLKGDKFLEFNRTRMIKRSSGVYWTFYEEDFSGSLFGFVKYKWTVKVLEDNSSVTINLSGIAFKYGIKLFNTLFI